MQKGVRILINKKMFESKLTTKQRKKLKDKVFGLPEQRKYPLHDEAHIRKAIQFFKYCPPVDRPKLAKNINMKALQFGMKLNISKDSIFYKYANKNIVEESDIFVQSDCSPFNWHNPCHRAIY